MRRFYYTIYSRLGSALLSLSTERIKSLIELCVCISLEICLKEFLLSSIIRCISFVCVCASNSFFSCCVSILVLGFHSIHLNTQSKSSRVFLSFETSITIVLHVRKKWSVFHHISTHLNG